MKKTDFLEDRTEKGNCLVTSDSTDFFVVIHDRLLERGDVAEGDKKEHLEGFDDKNGHYTAHRAVVRSVSSSK